MSGVSVLKQLLALSFAILVQDKVGMVALMSCLTFPLVTYSPTGNQLLQSRQGRREVGTRLGCCEWHCQSASTKGRGGELLFKRLQIDYCACC